MIQPTNVTLIRILYLIVYTIVVSTIATLLLSNPNPARCSNEGLQYKKAVSGYGQDAGKYGLDAREKTEPVPDPTDSMCEPRIKNAPTNCSTDSGKFYELMEKRRALVEERCGDLKQYRQESDPKEKWFMDKIGTKGVVYCPIFKAASSFTGAYFCQPYFTAEVCDNVIIGANRWRGKGVVTTNEHEGTPKLLTVRNPFDRVLSAYRDKIQALKQENPDRDNIFNEIVRHHRFISFEDHDRRDELLTDAKKLSREIPYVKGISVYAENSTNPYLNPVSATFPEFIKNLLTDHWRNEHWAEMTKQCGPCKEDYDFILKTEDYVCEFPMLLDAIGASNITINKNKKSNINDARKDAQYSDVFEYYGQLHDEEIDAFVKWFKDDCFLFDYDCEQLACEIKEWKRRN